LILAETSVVKGVPSVPHGDNLFSHFVHTDAQTGNEWWMAVCSKPVTDESRDTYMIEAGVVATHVP